MSRGKFIVTFIAKCTAEGMDPVECAKEEIRKLDEALKKIGELHRDRANYVALLEQFGDDSLKLHRTIPPQEEIPLADDTELAKDTRRAIVHKIDANGPMTIDELIQAIGSYREDSTITRAVKFMMERGIVERDDTPDHRVQPGPNWGEGA